MKITKTFSALAGIALLGVGTGLFAQEADQEPDSTDTKSSLPMMEMMDEMHGDSSMQEMMPMMSRCMEMMESMENMEDMSSMMRNGPGTDVSDESGSSPWDGSGT